MGELIIYAIGNATIITAAALFPRPPYFSAINYGKVIATFRYRVFVVKLFKRIGIMFNAEIADHCCSGNEVSLVDWLL